MELGFLFRWLVVFLGLGALALPLSTWLLRNWSAGAFAMPVAVAVIGLVGHLVGHVAFGWPAALGGLLALVVASAVTWPLVDVDWRGYAEAAVVFLAGFALVVAIRGVDPSAAPLPLAIGEKMLDFGLLATLDRTTALPPEDMWFAGETVAYHYGGHATTSLLATVTGTPPRFAYNLGLAGFYGMLLSAAYGLAGTIAAPYDLPRRYAAGLGAFFVGLASNLHTPAQFAAWLLPDGVASWLVQTAGVDASFATWSPDAIGGFWYFEASRVFPVDPTVPASETYMAATEFPLFAWLNGDLHAHMMSQPFMLLVAGLLLTYWRLEAVSDHRLVTLLGAIPPVAGFIGYVNIWSLPSVGGLVLIAVAFAPGEPLATVFERIPEPSAWRERLSWREHILAEELRRLGIAWLAATAVVIVGVLWTLPFWLGVVFQGPSQSLQLWDKPSAFGSLLLHHGAFLLAFVPYLAVKAAPELDSPVTIGAIAVLGAVAGVAAGVPAFGLFVPLALCAWWLLRTARDDDFALALLLAGAGLVLLVEVVTIDGERFNVVFKYYVHVWLFFAVGASVVLARLAAGRATTVPTLDRRRVALGGRALVALLVVTTSVYGAVALSVHFADRSSVVDERGPTLDATAYLEVEYPAEAPAIRWLDGREGRTTIVTAAPGHYRWRPSEGDGASAPASLTGLPTVLGWFHERQYRGDEPYLERREAVETMYAGTPDQRRHHFETYDVAYVYVGPAERNRYELAELGADDGLVVAKDFEDVTIYAYEGS